MLLLLFLDLDNNGVIETDSNGREMIARVLNKRPSSYPPLMVNEPVAGNYYPVNVMATLKDHNKTPHETRSLTAVVDRSQGGASIVNGSMELMVHRRLQVH